MRIFPAEIAFNDAVFMSGGHEQTSYGAQLVRPLA